MPISSVWRSILGGSRQRSKGDRWRTVVLKPVSIALVAGLNAALPKLVGAEIDQAACEPIDETELERAVE